MTVCPLALTVGCRKCVIFSVCPLKTLIGDQTESTEKTKPDEAARPSKNRSDRR